MVRFGRIILNLSHVVSVQRGNGTGNPLETIVTMRDGKVHTFSDHAQAVWEYFKSKCDNV